MKKSNIHFIALLGVALGAFPGLQAADVILNTGTYTDTQTYNIGTVNGNGNGTVVTFDSGANYTFDSLNLPGAWNRVTLNTGASLNVAGILNVDISGVSLNGGMLTTGGLLLHDSPNWSGSYNDGKQTLEYGDSVFNGSTIVANQSNAGFISMAGGDGAANGWVSNWFWLNGDGVTIDSNGFDIGSTMNSWGGGGLVKTGAGTLQLAASNNFTGNTLVSNGILEVTSTGKLYGGGYTASPTITVASTGTLRLNGWSWDAAGSIANLDYGRDRLVVNGGTIEYNGASNFNPGDPGSASRNLTIGTGGATLKASSTSGQTWTISSGNGNLVNNTGLTLTGAGAGEIQKVIEGSGTITKAGSGTWTLTAANTFSGATLVEGGTLLINGVHAAGLITTSSGGTLGGNGTVGNVDITDDGILSPGASAGHLTVNTLTLYPGAILNFELGAPTLVQDPGSDFVTVTDVLALDGTINITALAGFGSPVLGDSWRIMSAAGGVTDLGLTIGSAPALAGGLAFAIDASNNSDVFLTVVPEAGTAGLFGLALLILRRILGMQKF